MEKFNNLEELNYIHMKDGMKLNLTNLYSEIDKREKLNVNEFFDIYLDNYKINVLRFNNIIYTINVYNSHSKKNVLENFDILINPFQLLFREKYITMTSIAKFKELISVIPNYKELSFYCDIHKEQFYYAFGDLIKHYQKYNNVCFYTLRKKDFQLII